MKKIVVLFLTLSLMLGMSAALSSCKKNAGKTGDVVNETTYSELGLNFTLPEDFRKFTVQNADIHYSTPDVTFEVQYMPKSDFEDIELGYYISFDMTVREYAEFLINENGWTDPEKEEQYTYDEARNCASFYIFWTPDPEEFPYSYYHFTIMKNDYAFYAIMFSCEEEKYPDYKDKIDAWSKKVSLVDAATQ